MAADSGWMKRNLGAPALAAGEALAVPEAALAQAGGDRALARIEFDSEGPEGTALRSAWPTAPPSLDSFVAIDWPDGLAPQPATTAPAGEKLPDADVLIVTWTADEGHALSRVLTPGLDSMPPSAGHPGVAGMKYWQPYARNYDELVAKMKPGAPARHYHRLGTYWTADHRHQEGDAVQVRLALLPGRGARPGHHPQPCGVAAADRRLPARLGDHHRHRRRCRRRHGGRRRGGQPVHHLRPRRS